LPISIELQMEREKNKKMIKAGLKCSFIAQNTIKQNIKTKSKKSKIY